MLSCTIPSITGTLPALRGALLFPAQMLGGMVVSAGANSCQQCSLARLHLCYDLYLHLEPPEVMLTRRPAGSGPCPVHVSR